LTGSNPENGAGFPLSGISIPAFKTRTEFAEIAAGFSPEETNALRVEINIIKKRIEARMIPTIVARTYFKKSFIFRMI